MDKKPIAVLIIGIYSLVYGSLAIIDSLVQTFAYIKFSEKMQVAYRNSNLGLILFSLLLFVCLFVGGIAILRKKKWGKVLVQISLTVQILYVLYFSIPLWKHWFSLDGYHRYAFFRPRSAASVFTAGIVDLIPKILVLFFLTRHKVKEQFR